MKRIVFGGASACALAAIAALLVATSALSSTTRLNSSPTHAAVTAPPAPPVYFNGQQIDIANGAAAQLDCVIYLTYGACFHTVTEMKADEARVAASNTPDGAAVPSAQSRGLTSIRSPLWFARPLSA